MANIFYARKKSDQEAIEAIAPHIKENRLALRTQACFASYAYAYNGDDRDGHFYFGYYSDDKIVKMAEEFNGKFKNIKFIILESWNVSTIGYNLSFGKKSPNKFYVMKIELNPKFSQEANFFLTLAIAQFFRAFNPEYVHYGSVDEKREKDFIQHALDVYNEHAGLYGTWAGSIKVDLETFMKLDNMAAVEKLCKGLYTGNFPYVSKLLRGVKNVTRN